MVDDGLRPILHKLASQWQVIGVIRDLGMGAGGSRGKGICLHAHCTHSWLRAQ